MFDTGALIALERHDRRVHQLVEGAVRREARIVVPAGSLAQAVRNLSRQAVLARFLRLPTTSVRPLDERDALAVGALLAHAGSIDVVDAHVAVVALRDRLRVLTSDPDDIARLAPGVPIWAI